MKSWKNKFIIMKYILTVTLPFYIVKATAGASTTIAESQIFTGATNLAKDLTTAFVALSVGVGAAVEVYLFIKLQMADDDEGRMVKKKQKTTLYATVGAALVSATLKLIVNYFSSTK